jgi:hypothetical protein
MAIAALATRRTVPVSTAFLLGAFASLGGFASWRRIWQSFIIG